MVIKNETRGSGQVRSSRIKLQRLRVFNYGGGLFPLIGGPFPYRSAQKCQLIGVSNIQNTDTESKTHFALHFIIIEKSIRFHDTRSFEKSCLSGRIHRMVALFSTQQVFGSHI